MEATQPSIAEQLASYPYLLTPPDVAGIIRQSAKSARKLMAGGQIPGAFKIGARWYVTKADFSAFVERESHAAA